MENSFEIEYNILLGCKMEYCKKSIYTENWTGFHSHWNDCLMYLPDAADTAQHSPLFSLLQSKAALHSVVTH